MTSAQWQKRFVRVLDACGGRYAAAALGRTTPQSLYTWQADGAVRSSIACLELARVAAPVLKLDAFELSRSLAGLDG